MPRSSGSHSSSRSCKFSCYLRAHNLLLTFHSIIIPWTTIRKVPVEVTVVSAQYINLHQPAHIGSPKPSPRTAIVKFQRGIQQGLLGRISRTSVMEYHGFGIISEGIESGCHYMIVGVQGDWTRSIANDPPKYLWTREMKVRVAVPHSLPTSTPVRGYSQAPSFFCFWH